MVTDARLDHGYTTETTPQGTKISFKGDGLGTGAMIIGVIASTILLSFWGIGLIFFALIGFQYYRRSRNQEFLLEGDGIVIGGKRYRFSDVSEIELTNDVDKAAQFSSGASHGVMVGGALAATTTNAMVGLSNAGLKSRAKRSFRVSIRHGRHVVPVAKFLTEDKAISIFKLLTRD